MKPLQQLFALVLEQISGFQKKKGSSLRTWRNELVSLAKQYPDPEQHKKKEDALRNKEVKALRTDVSTGKGMVKVIVFLGTIIGTLIGIFQFK